MRVLIAGSQKISWGAPGWARGLRDLGLEVIEWDWASFYSPGFLGRCEQRLAIGPGVLRANNELIQAVNRYKPDITLLYATWPIFPVTVKKISNTCWVSGYHNDNPFGDFGKKAYFRHWRKAIPYFHSHHVFRQRNVKDYNDIGAKRVSVLLPFYTPWLDKPISLSTDEKRSYQNEIVFVGHAENDHRIEYLKKMIRDGLPITIYGAVKYWEKYLPLEYRRKIPPIKPVYGIEYRKVIASSKICLSFFSRSNADDCTFRVFEIPAVGGLLFAERTQMMQELYTEGLEAEFFSSPEELFEKCVNYLKDDLARSDISKNGMFRCLNSKYDINSRMNQWLGDINNWMFE